MKTKTKDDRKKAANVMQLWRGVDARKMAKIPRIPVFSAAEMARGRKVGLFRLGEKGWNTLEEARADLLKKFRRDMRRMYPAPYALACSWVSDEEPVRSDKPFMRNDTRYVTSCTIWDLRGKKLVSISGRLSCIATGA